MSPEFLFVSALFANFYFGAFASFAKIFWRPARFRPVLRLAGPNRTGDQFPVVLDAARLIQLG